MNTCPKCESTLRERKRGPVVVDVCPRCAGMWLDAGELEKLTRSEDTYYERRHDDDDDWDTGMEREEGFGGPRRRRRGFLQNLLEGLGD